MKTKTAFVKAFMITLAFLFSYSAVKSQCTFEEGVKIVSSDRELGDYFGYRVSISGDYAIVGAPEEDQDTAGSAYMVGSGSAYIYKKDQSGNWIQSQKLIASDRYQGDYFGSSVFILDDYAIVGAYGQDEDTANANVLTRAGCAYIFKKNANGYWNEVQMITASDRSMLSYFGWDVSLSGNYAVIGARGESKDAMGANHMNSAGAVYIFKMDINGYWTEVQKLVASDRESAALFGYSLSASGDHLLIGARLEDKDISGSNPINGAGAAYIFKLDSAGTWNELQKIVASDRDLYDLFGASVAISENFAIISSVQDSEDENGNNFISASGSAYIFKKDGNGNWNQTQKIVASDRGFEESFGWKVDISEDYIIVGSPFDDQVFSDTTINEAGAVYVFERDSSGAWTEIKKITASDQHVVDVFGWDVSLSEDYIIVGSFYNDYDDSGMNPLSDAGSAYIFNICCKTPSWLAENNVTYNSATLSWEGVSGAASYIVEGGIQGEVFVQFQLQSNVFEKTNLNVNKTYEWRVKTVCANGNTSEFSDWSSFTTSCEAPVNLSVSNLTSNSASLSWDAVSYAVGYRLRGGPLGGSVTNYDIPDTVLYATGLSSGITFAWKVWTYCSVSPNPLIISAWSDDHFFTTSVQASKTGNETTHSQLNGLTVYPNPTNGSFEISNLKPESEVSIYNVNGKLVYQNLIKDRSNLQLNMEDLEKGIYLIKVVSWDNAYSKTIVIQ